MARKGLMLSAALGMCLAAQAHAQDNRSPSLPADQRPSGDPAEEPVSTPSLQDRHVDLPTPSAQPVSQDPQEIEFTADAIDYDSDADIVTATGDVHLYRRSDKLRADKVVWNRQTGKVTAEGNVVVANPQGDASYGDKIDLTDSLKDGVVENMLVVLDAGGRLAAEHGERHDDGVITVQHAAYSPCAVNDSSGCPKEPSWKITANTVTYDPNKKRIHYTGAHISVFKFVTIPLPAFSHPAGGQSENGLLQPDVRYNRTNGLQLSAPYFFSLAPNQDLTITPRVFTNTLPMIQADYRRFDSIGAFRVSAYATYSSRADDLTVPVTEESLRNDFRGYIDAAGTFQLGNNWTASGSIRLVTDQTFLKRYYISTDDRLRNNLRVEHIDNDSYFSINAWVIQTLRVGERQGLQPFALPELEYRRRVNEGLLGGHFDFEVNTLSLDRSAGQDTQRAFASAQWSLRKLTAWGQEITFTAYSRGDIYNASDTLSTSVVSYRGDEGFTFRGIAAAAVDMKWPLIGEAFGGTQTITPRVQVVASPKLANMDVPNEDSRAVDLEDSNLFALNRFPGYDRFEDSTRFTYGLDYALYLPGFSIDSNIGQSYRISSRPTLFPDGTGLTDRVSDIVGRTVIRFRDFLSFTHRYRLDKDNLAFRRNEVDMTIGSRATYAQIGYLRLNRNITDLLEDLQDHEELRLGARAQITRFWSLSGSTLINLTGKDEDPLVATDGFDPVRHRVSLTYEDDCLRLGVTWRRDYATTGDAVAGNSFLFTLAFKNLGR